MGSHRLVPVRMTKADMERTDVQAFHCGDEPHEKPLADWLRLHSADQIKGGCKVWLYRLDNEDGSLVGYGSLSADKIEITTGSGGKTEIKVFTIPMLALDKNYWGEPKGVADVEEKFSRQIVRHLQEQAKESQKRGNRERYLCLYVHPDAEQAQALYSACRFTFAPGRFLFKPDIPIERGGALLGMDYVW